MSISACYDRQNDYEALKKKRAERANEKDEGVRKGPRGASPSGGQNSGICFTWQNTGDCPSMSTCKWTHPAEAKGVSSKVKSLIALENAGAATSAVAGCRNYL